PAPKQQSPTNAPPEQPPTQRQTDEPPVTPPQTQPTASESQSASTGANSVDTVETASDTTIRRNVNEVPVVFTVTDKHNHYVRDLDKKDFKVIDDGRPVEEIRSFRRETDLPLRVGLLIDSSASVRGRFKFEQEAAIEFMNQTIRPRYDRAFVLGFDTNLEITQEFTDKAQLLSNG